MIWSWVLLGVGFALFLGGLLAAWSPWGLVLSGCVLMLWGAVRDDGTTR